MKNRTKRKTDNSLSVEVNRSNLDFHNVLKKTMNDVVYKMWIEDACFIFEKNTNIFTLITTSEFKCNVIEESLYAEIEKTINNFLGINASFEYCYINNEAQLISLFEKKTPKSKLKKWEQLLDEISNHIIMNNSDVNCSFLANELKNCKLTIENKTVRLDFKDLDLLKMIKKSLTTEIISVLKIIIPEKNIALKYYYNGAEYDEFI